MSDQLIVILKTRWEQLLSNFELSASMTQSLWNKIEKKYNHRHRKYHNLQHLHNMFTELDQLTLPLDDPEVLQFSIWFHDLIYQPIRKDNELKSANMARQYLQEIGLNVERIKRCYQQILLTKHHQFEHPAQVKIDEQYLIDFDLEILSRSWEEYLEYSQQIREEYWMYPRPIYNKGRKAALQQFLKRPFIYQTDEYRERKEEKARENILREVEGL